MLEIERETARETERDVAGRVLGPRDPEWPQALREIPDPPTRLHVEGLALDPDAPRIAIVGTRRPTAAGIAAAQRLSHGLAEAGITVVSGLALGIDAVAHRAALEAGGRTIAVLGCGLDVDYPRRNAALREQIVSGGTILSEYPAGVRPQPFHFPQRNRIVAGLSLGVIVVEGSLKSGALITARLGLEFDRNVYAVPGSTRNPMAAGPHWLIRTFGAMLVTGPEDVLDDLAPALGERLIRGEEGHEGKPAGRREISGEEAAVLDLLDDEPVPLDTLVAHSGLPLGRVAAAAASLEMKGLARRMRTGYAVGSS